MKTLENWIHGNSGLTTDINFAEVANVFYDCFSGIIKRAKIFKIVFRIYLRSAIYIQ